MSKRNPSVDGFIRKNKAWQEGLEALREILLDCPLVEDVKWRVPAYTLDGQNVVLVTALKDHFVLSFLKGALMKDEKGLLEVPGPNTQSARVIRLTTGDEVRKLASTIKAYVLEAIELEKSGAKFEYKKVTEFAVPEEFQFFLDEMPELKKAYEALTPGRRRAYLLHFSSAKQSKTRTARVEKYVQHILNGKGIDDE